MEGTADEEPVSVPAPELSGNVWFDNGEYSFEEILPPETDSCPHMVEALCVHVEPSQCSRVLKELSEILPLEEDLAHLKRVRKVPTKPVPAQESGACKRPKLLLQVLLGSRKQQEQWSSTDSASASDLPCSRIHAMVEKYGPLHAVTVPGRPPRSHDEWKEWNNTIWPVQFLPLRTKEYQRLQSAPSSLELSKMREHMEECISQSIVVVVDPSDDTTVSSCRTERALQEQQPPLLKPSSQRLTLDNNPLATPVLLAIQGVSRREREATLSVPLDVPLSGSGVKGSSDGGMDVSPTRNSQYLCTGFDMYCYYEPNVFEAMACLHSRLRRLIFFRQRPDNSEGVLPPAVSRAVFPNGCSKHFIHNLRGTNHRYRVFEYHRSGSAEMVTIGAAAIPSDEPCTDAIDGPPTNCDTHTSAYDTT
jgi:hypothetical protein